jgi:hypothetical protein
MAPGRISPLALLAAVLSTGVAAAQAQQPLPIPMPRTVPPEVPTAAPLPAVAPPPAVTVAPPPTPMPPAAPAAPATPAAPTAPAAPAVVSEPAVQSVPCPDAPCCPAPACPPARTGPRLIVVKVPTPSVIFRPSCRTGGCTTPAGKPAPAGTPAPTTGMATVYHTYTYPYMTYNYMPVAHPGVTGFAGAAPTAGVFQAGAVGASPALTGGLLTGDLESLLLRALFSRFVQPAANQFLQQIAPQPTADPCEAKVRALQAQIAELDKRIEALRKDTHDATLLNTRAIVDLQKEVDRLFDAITALNPADNKEKIVGDLKAAVQKIQDERKK